MNSAAVEQVSSRPCVVNVIAHPDDELIGSGAAMLALRDAGFDVVVSSCGVQEPAVAARRADELRRAGEAGGYRQVALPLTGGLDHEDRGPAARQALVDAVRAVLVDLQPALVLLPHPHDAHPSHERVAGVVRDAVGDGRWRSGGQLRLWLWSLWSDLAAPTLYLPFSQARSEQVLAVLRHHRGELARQPYDRLFLARGSANAVLGSERVFGWGAGRAHPAPFAELFTELALVGGRLRSCPPRVCLDVAADVAPTDHDREWLFDRESIPSEADRRDAVGARTTG